MDLLDQVMEATFASEQTLQIESYANMRQFRTATELREGKGNHIAASIKILPPPKKNVTQRLELSLVPADGTDQVQHMIHPNFLCINIKDQRKIVYRNDLTNPRGWKADFMIKNEEVFHVDNITGEWRKVEILRDGNTLELGKYTYFLFIYSKVGYSLDSELAIYLVNKSLRVWISYVY